MGRNQSQIIHIGNCDSHGYNTIGLYLSFNVSNTSERRRIRHGFLIDVCVHNNNNDIFIKKH